MLGRRSDERCGLVRGAVWSPDLAGAGRSVELTPPLYRIGVGAGGGPEA